MICLCVYNSRKYTANFVFTQTIDEKICLCGMELQKEHKKTPSIVLRESKKQRITRNVVVWQMFSCRTVLGNVPHKDVWSGTLPFLKLD